jgi:hypothetical protein
MKKQVLADKILPRDKGTGWRNRKRGREGISAYWDCSHPYYKVFEMKKDDYLPPEEIQLLLKREATQDRVQ